MELYGYVEILVYSGNEGEDTVMWNCMAMYRYWYRHLLKVRITFCVTVWLCRVIGIDKY